MKLTFLMTDLWMKMKMSVGMMNMMMDILIDVSSPCQGQLVCIIFSWLLPTLTEIINHKIAHSLCLICGGIGLISLVFVDRPLLVLFPMIGFGIAWSSILAIPYSILSRTLTGQNTGLYMGIFNAFIVLPQIFAALGLGWIMKIFFNSNCLLVVVVGGFSLLLAAVLIYFVEEY